MSIHRRKNQFGGKLKKAFFKIPQLFKPSTGIGRVNPNDRGIATSKKRRKK